MAAATQTVHGQATPTPDPASAGWTTAHVSLARQEKAMATVGHRVLFAGGWTGENSARQWQDTVDVYDDETGAWSTATLSAARPVRTAAVLGDLVIFASTFPDTAGSDPGRVLDIYDGATDTWSTGRLSFADPIDSVVMAGTRVLFVASGDRVDIFDTATGQWATKTLATSRTYPAVAVAGQQVVIVGTTRDIAETTKTSAPPDARTPVDVYDGAADRWAQFPRQLRRVADHRLAGWRPLHLPRPGLLVGHVRASLGVDDLHLRRGAPRSSQAATTPAVRHAHQAERSRSRGA